MTKTLNKMTAMTVSAMAVAGMSSGAVFAQTASNNQGRSYQANLTSLNKSDDRGNATVVLNVDGNKVTVRSTGVSANLPHAQHIHIGGTNSCPTPAADKNNDGLIDTAEGQPSYGPIEISLTTNGDVGKDSGLAVDRFPVANADGTITYERTITLPDGVTEEMVAKGVIVQHGISELYGDKTKYDGEKKSPLKAELPLEATIPSSCGKLVALPVGGADAGNGGSSESTNMAMIAAGSTALAGASLLAYTRKRNHSNV